MLQVTMLLKSKYIFRIFSWHPLVETMKYPRNHLIVLVLESHVTKGGLGPKIASVSDVFLTTTDVLFSSTLLQSLSYIVSKNKQASLFFGILRLIH
jgi:hypothetical protein